MKKSFFFATMLLSIAATAQQRTFVKSVGANYATKQVTFNISWAAGSRETVGANVYNSKVWVLIDYQEVQNGVAVGSWKRAGIVLSSLPANCTADGSNTKGFWYQGQPSATQNANITVTLSGIPAQFNWCAFATDYPPNAAAYNGGVHTLKGTAPFVINGSTIVTNTAYSGTINTITDATGCPGWIERDVPTVSGTCRPGLTLVGGYCRDLAADNAAAFTGCGIEIKAADAGRIMSYSLNRLCPAGWRWPDANEIACMYTNRAVLNLPPRYEGCYWDIVCDCGTNATTLNYRAFFPNEMAVLSLLWSNYYSCGNIGGVVVRCVR